MGREVKRVPLDFDHPLGRVWYGYQIVFCHEDYEGGCERCKEFARIMGIPPKLYKNIPDDDIRGRAEKPGIQNAGGTGRVVRRK